MATPSGILLHTVNKGNVGLLSSADVAFTIPELFRRAAARHPRKVAVVGQTWQPDYETLDTEANRVAHILCREGVSPGTRVAVLMPHDAPLFAAVLGVLKAGAVVVVVNPADPTVRMEQVLANAATETLLADPGLAAMAGKALSLPVRVLTWVPGQSELCADDPGVRVAPDSLAFLLYTSGTTGIPKGVMQSHENLVHNAYRFTCGLGLHEGDCISLFALLGGGQGVAVTWSAFLNGATLCPFPMAEKGVTGLGDWLARNEVSVFISTSSVFRHFMKSLPVGTTLSTVRLVRIGAEHAAKEDFEDFLNHFRDGCQFAHTFSSTEAGSLTQIFFSKGSLPTDERLSVGFPLPDVELHLHDASGREVPEGQIGEIVVRSRYLTPGYWRNETLTAARFRNDETTPGGRLFSTGDLARRSPDGSLMLVGRNDSQVKVRGHRIELTEVEIALKTIPGVLDSAACVVAEESGSGKLAAFVVTRSGDAHSSRDLREELKRRLPDHLVPSLFYFPQSLPLTAQGKLDRRALPHLLESPQTEVGNSPATDTEELLAHIWAGAFNHKVVSCDDDFFELGGDSLIAAVIAARIHDALGVRLELATFSNHLTVRRMSHEVDQRLAAMIESDWSPARLLTVERPDELPLSLAQERLWHFCQASDVSAKYVQTWAEQISGPLDVSILQRSIEEVVRRHEALRTTFMRGMQGPVQIVHPPGAVELPVVHLDNSYDIEHAAMDWLAHEARKPMDLEIGPVVRFCLIRLREQEHWLLRTGHHIVTDDWSWGIFYREVLHIYACMRKGMPPPWLEELPIQYADYALWQRLQHGTPGDREQIEWWKRYLHGQPQSFVPPFARQTPDPFAAPEDGVIWWGLPEPVSARLGHMARKEGVTFFALRLAAFAALLSFESGQDDFAFGAYFTNRQSVELQRLFGYFSNLATLRFRVERSTPFLRWLKQVREMVLAIQSHSEIPYESLCGQLRDESVNPPEIRAIFSSMAPRQYQGCDGLVFSTIERMRTSVPWGFSFSVSEECETSACKVSFDARIYDPDGVRCLISRFQRFMTVISERPELPLEELFLCATSDEEQGASWGVGECRSPMVAAWNCNHH